MPGVVRQTLPDTTPLLRQDCSMPALDARLASVRAMVSARYLTLASQGLMVIYRGSGVLNFAHGAIGMVGAYIHWEVKIKYGNPAWIAWIAALSGCALIGALAHLLIMRQLQRASPLARIVATLGLLVVLFIIEVLAVPPSVETDATEHEAQQKAEPRPRTPA